MNLQHTDECEARGRKVTRCYCAAAPKAPACSTQARCGEHGLPLRHESGGISYSITCAEGCSLVWGDLHPEVDETVRAHAGFVYVIDLQEPYEAGRSRAGDHVRYVEAYGGDIEDEEAPFSMAPGYVVHHFADAVRDAYFSGWTQGISDAAEETSA